MLRGYTKKFYRRNKLLRHHLGLCKNASIEFNNYLAYKNLYYTKQNQSYITLFGFVKIYVVYLVQ